MKDWILNREWVVFLGLVGTTLLEAQGVLDSDALTLEEAIVGLTPVVSAFVARLRVWSNRSVSEL